MILKKKHKKVDVSLEMAILHQFTIILNTELVPWTEIEPQTAITNQPEESKEKR